MTDHPAIERGLGPEDGADLAGAALALARRFAAGATMWCLAPEWPGARAPRRRRVRAPRDHGQARAARRRRRRRRSGDVRCGRSRATRRRPVRGGDRRRTAACVRGHGRARVWGLTTVWIGAGDPPGRGRGRPRALGRRPTAEPERCDALAAYDGSLVLRYHVLWELTHVCFEHPGSARSRRRRRVRRRRHVHHLLRRGHARRGRHGRRHGRGVGAHRGRRRADRREPRRPGRSRRSRARPRRHRHRASSKRRAVSEGTDFLYPFIEGDERDAEALLRDLAASAEGKGAVSGALATGRPSTARRRRSTPRPRRWRSGSRAAGGCSRSATAGAPPTRRRSRRCSRVRRRALPLPARCLADDSAVLTALGERRRVRPRLLAPADRARGAAATSRSASRRAATRATCSSRSTRRPDGACSPSVSPATTAARWPRASTCDTASSSATTACTASRRRRPRSAARCGARCRRGAGAVPSAYDVADATHGDGRRPRSRGARPHRRVPAAAAALPDDVVTLAHGAGGKASAALVDAVFLDAFVDGEPGAAARRGDAHARRRASGSRSAPTRSS